MEVLFFQNGNTAILENGKQMPRIQKSWLILFAKYLESKGIDPTKVSFSLPLGLKAKVFKTSDDDYNWEITK